MLVPMLLFSALDTTISPEYLVIICNANVFEVFDNVICSKNMAFSFTPELLQHFWTDAAGMKLVYFTQ